MFTSLPQDSPLTSIICGENGTTKVHSIDQVRPRQKITTDRMQASLDDMHRDVASKSEKFHRLLQSKGQCWSHEFLRSRLCTARCSQKRTRAQPFNASERTFRSEYIFLIDNLMNSKREEVQGRRIKFYRNKYYELSEALQGHLSYQQNKLLVSNVWTTSDGAMHISNRRRN